MTTPASAPSGTARTTTSDMSPARTARRFGRMMALASNKPTSAPAMAPAINFMSGV